MQTIRFSAALAAALALLVGFASSSRGQAPGGQPPLSAPPPVGAGQAPAARAAPPTGGGVGVNNIAVVDVVYIFKTYPKFKQQMDVMKQRVEGAEADIKREAEELKRLQEQARQFQPNTDGFKRAEEAMMRKQGEMQLKVSQQKRQFMEDEGKIYFSISREIDDAIKVLANRYNLALVLRFSGIDNPDPNDRNQVMQGIQKSIMYHHPQMDITPYVLTELQRGNPGGGMATPNPNASLVPQQRRQ